ncbi:MAG: hypothetical protein OXU45_04910 [Candidatus Melainabacteria bacterium]|nr:hypothetical protein [Candidatus Melainabacteria bacterium]
MTTISLINSLPTLAKAYEQDDAEDIAADRSSLPAPKAELELVAVVPISGELSNSNFFLQLKDLARLNLEPERFELIYVVNNTKASKKNLRDNYRENQLILDLIQYLNGETVDLPSRLQAWQAEIIEEAKRKKINIRSLDLSSEGVSEKNITRDRIQGHRLAHRRLAETGDGIVITLDADTRFRQDLLQNTIDQINTRGLNMINFVPDYQLSETPKSRGMDFALSHPEHRFKHHYFKLARLLSCPTRSNWKAYRASSLDLPVRFDLDSHAIMHSLEPSSHVGRAYGFELYTSDRARDHDTGGQCGATRLTDFVNQDYESEAFRAINAHSFLARYLEGRSLCPADLCSAIEFAESIREKLREEIDRSDHHFFDSLINESIRKERARFGYKRSLVHRLIKSEFDVNENLGKPIFERGSYGADFLARNSWFEAKIFSLYAGHDDPAAAIEAAAEQYPEFLGDFDRTEYTKATAILAGINKFLEYQMS